MYIFHMSSPHLMKVIPCSSVGVFTLSITEDFLYSSFSLSLHFSSLFFLILLFLFFLLFIGIPFNIPFNVPFNIPFINTFNNLQQSCWDYPILPFLAVSLLLSTSYFFWPRNLHGPSSLLHHIPLDSCFPQFIYRLVLDLVKKKDKFSYSPPLFLIFEKVENFPDCLF